MRLLIPTLLFSLAGCAGKAGEGLFDLDGDGRGSSVDCDDGDPAIVGPYRFYTDDDGDGFGVPGEELEEGCQPPPGFADNGADCDDDDPDRNPAADELCDEDEVDEDCDGRANDEDDDAVDRIEGFLDDDGDGYGAVYDVELFCELPGDRAEEGTDCDDGNRQINPGEDEVCDDADADEDCDGLTDDADDSVESLIDWYVDADGDGYGDARERREGCEGEAGEVAVARDCDDADADISPEADEVCGDGIDQDCDGSADACVPTGDLLDEDAEALVLGDEVDALFGWSMAAGGDVDGDGLEEVWVTGPAAAGLGAGSGGAFAIEGRLEDSDDPAGHGLVVVRSTEVYELGYSVASGGDLDGDGLDDLVLGSPLENSTATDAGTVWVLTGPVLDGVSEVDAYASRTGTAYEDTWGFSVAVGDWNGDGTADLFASGGGYETIRGELGPIAPGEASSATAGDIAITATVGERLAMGDVDGDGLDELALGDWGLSRVKVYEGGGSSAGTLLGTIDTDSYNIGLGFAVLLKDVDGDGLADIVAGAPYYDGSRGAVYIVHGPMAGGTYGDDDVDVFMSHDTEEVLFGYALAANGDMNANGDVELVVGAPARVGPAEYSGAAYVFDGAPTSGDHEIDDADLVIKGARDYGQDGFSLGIADLDGDGSSDLVVGAINPGGVVDGGGAAIVYGALP